MQGIPTTSPYRFRSPSFLRAIGEHLQIGIAAIGLLQSQDDTLHSRKLRSFDEPPFR
jgi:AMP nucleosidase